MGCTNKLSIRAKERTKFEPKTLKGQVPLRMQYVVAPDVVLMLVCFHGVIRYFIQGVCLLSSERAKNRRKEDEPVRNENMGIRQYNVIWSAQESSRVEHNGPSNGVSQRQRGPATTRPDQTGSSNRRVPGRQSVKSSLPFVVSLS